MMFDMFRACQTCLIQPFTKRQRKDGSDKTGTTVFFCHCSLNLSFLSPDLRKVGSSNLVKTQNKPNTTSIS